MSNDSSFNVFTLGEEFINNYRDIMIDFFSEKDHNLHKEKNRVDRLLSILKLRFMCQHVLVCQYDLGSNDIHVINETVPITEDEIVNNMRMEIRTELPIWLTSGDYSGSSFNLLRNSAVGKYLEVDIIPLIGTAISKSEKEPIYLFVLIDSLVLKPLVIYVAERNFQRSLIANFIQGWWIKVFTRRPFGNIQHSKQYPYKYTYDTLSELLDAGYESAKILRHSNLSINKEVYFQEEISGDTFNWDTWSPRFPFISYNFNKDQRSRYVYLSKLLIYYCRWINSHRELDEEKSDRETVSDWVKQQRINVDKSVFTKLSEIHNLASRSFISEQNNLISIITERKNQELSINKKSLLTFSLHKWLEPEGQLCKELNSTALSDNEFCRNLHGIAIITHYLFVEEAENISEEVIYRLMQFVSRYGHRELGVPNRIDLRSHLFHTVRGEPALHTLKPFYRDHFVHALEVCFLGHVLLETKIGSDQYLWQLVGRQISIKNDKKRILKLWYMTSLLHDIGYTMDLVDSSRKYLEFFKHSEVLKQLQMDFDYAIKKNLTNADEIKNLGIDIEPGMEHDHGLIGALHLSSLLKNIQLDDPTIDMEEYKHTIQAIALHNMRRSKDRISFSDKPFAFLLAFCDQIQEWRRLRLPYSTSPLWMLSKYHNDSIQENAIKDSFNSLKTNLLVADSDGTINIECPEKVGVYPKLRLTLEYDERINRNGAVFNLWLDATLNFQRLDFEGLPLDLLVEYKTPYYYDKNSGIYAKQLHRLKDAWHETNMSFLSDWFPTANVSGDLSSITNGIVTHKSDDKNKKEILSLDLRKLSNKMLVSRDLQTFWQHFKAWKHFNDDRDFFRDYAPFDPE